jgi:hypothetical protein
MGVNVFLKAGGHVYPMNFWLMKRDGLMKRFMEEQGRAI